VFTKGRPCNGEFYKALFGSVTEVFAVRVYERTTL